MRPNHKSLRWGAWLVLIAAVLQGLSWWINFDRFSFGPKGAGTAALQHVFGPGTHPFAIAVNIDHVVRGLVVLILGILVFSLLMAENAYEYAYLAQARRRAREYEKIE